MLNKEFNLSNEIEWKTKVLGELNQLAVKEFIKIDKENFDTLELHLAHIDCERCKEKIEEYKNKRTKLAGDKLF